MDRHKFHPSTTTSPDCWRCGRAPSHDIHLPVVEEAEDVKEEIYQRVKNRKATAAVEQGGESVEERIVSKALARISSHE